MSRAILDNLRAYQIELEVVQAECLRESGAPSPCIALSLSHLAECVALTSALLHAAGQAAEALADAAPDLSRHLSAVLATVTEEAPE